MTREEKIRQREAWLVQQIERLKQEYTEACKPFAEELLDIRASRPPVPHLGKDGNFFHYVGPLPKYLLPEERGRQ